MKKKQLLQGTIVKRTNEEAMGIAGAKIELRANFQANAEVANQAMGIDYS